jgi:hypothetical protein
MPTILADGIGLEGVLLLGCFCFVLPLLFVVVLEWVIVALIARPGRWPALRLVFFMNVLSLVAGIPVWLWFMDLFIRVPSDLHVYFDAYWLWSVGKYLTYFAVTLAVELSAAAIWRRSRPGVPRRRLLVAVCLANVASYAILSPAYYYSTRPRHTVREFAADTRWAPPGLGPIVYLDGVTDHLMRIDADGRNRLMMVDYPMDAYMLSDDLRTCLFVRGDHLYVAKPGSIDTPRQIGRRVNAGRASMAGVALSPRQVRAAYLSIVPNSGLELTVVDLETGHSEEPVRIPRSDPAGLTWRDEDSVWVYSYWHQAAPLRVPTTCPTPLLGAETKPAPMSAPFAAPVKEAWVFKSGGEYPEDEPRGEERSWDDFEDLHASVEWVLGGCWASIRRGGDSSHNPPLLMLADNPGISFLETHRAWGEIAFMPGTRLCILEDTTFNAVYLLDSASGRVGKLVDGHCPVVLSAKYRRH